MNTETSQLKMPKTCQITKRQEKFTQQLHFFLNYYK